MTIIFVKKKKKKNPEVNTISEFLIGFEPTNIIFERQPFLCVNEIFNVLRRNLNSSTQSKIGIKSGISWVSKLPH
jgi:hypothetical protein